MGLSFLVRPTKIKGTHLSQDAPTDFVPMPHMHSSAALDPRVDISSDISHDPVFDELNPEHDAEPPIPTADSAPEAPVASSVRVD